MADECSQRKNEELVVTVAEMDKQQFHLLHWEWDTGSLILYVKNAAS
jgi:hypothetical protein